MKRFVLSPNTLTLFLECPRCFWFHIIKGEDFRRPEGPSSTLPRGMDNLIKKYFDNYRKKNLLPPEIAHIENASLVDEETISRWRYWKTGLFFQDRDGSKLYGALDECLIVEGFYVPLDYKTRGFKLKEDSASYYTFQMSCYNFLLESNGYKVKDYAYLVFYVPSQVSQEGMVRFDTRVVRIKTLSSQRVYHVFKEAVDCLNLPSPPLAKECKFCRWAEKIVNWGKEQISLF
ncbi:MAG: hypothetical protein DRP81_05080 [Candidatus Omnitrophota bacterium]|nr:MAG: hypothetical protein DRP81_05080 [Candidatus Omnitrophota bacterium]HDN86149.1 hypothetical protein [Candidatus Omnitrophota bacterium]